MRAAFKAVEFGKQVAVLVPTTVLAEQHYRSFQRADGELPVRDRVDQPVQDRQGSRRRPSSGSRQGEIDILIGTHRLISKDVKFADLGPGRHRRGAALRRDAQGAAEADAQDGGRADDVGHADPAHAAHVDARPARHQLADDRAAGPAQRRDGGDAVRPATASSWRSCASCSARGRSTSSTTACTTSWRSPTRSSSWCPTPGSSSATGRWARASWKT